MRFLLPLLAVLLGPAPVAGSREADIGRPDVLAFYYPWYVKGDWSRHAHAGTPALGLYGTDSAEVAEQHIAWCAQGGINGLFVSWWGPGHMTDDHLRKGLLEAANLEKIRFCIFYESLRLDPVDGRKDGQVDFAVPAVMDRLLADMGYLRGLYLAHPRYYAVGGRPVIGFYVTRIFRNLTPGHLERLRTATGRDPFLVADEVFFGGQGDPATARHGAGIFDAYTAYNMFENNRVVAGESALDYQRRESWPPFRRWRESPGTAFVPCVLPSYRDFRGHKPLSGTPGEFRILLEEAGPMASPLDSSGTRLLLITSFNEWWEGTTIEPAKEYGAAFLEALSTWKADP